MTQEEFDDMPLLLTRSDLQACGLPKDVVYHLIESGALSPFKSRKNGYKKYYKHEVAKILKLDIKGQRKVGAANGGNK